MTPPKRRPRVGPGSKPHEHTPMKALYWEYRSKSDPEKVVSRKLIGYQCQCGCRRIYTANGNLSEEQRVEDKHGWVPRFFPNKSHYRRVADALK